MKKAAVLLDGGFVVKRLRIMLGHVDPSADQVYEFAQKCVEPDEELFRIYFYDCHPFGEQKQHPISRAMVDFAATATYRRQTRLHEQLAVKNYVAFRAGMLSFDGWALTRDATRQLTAAPRPIVAADFQPDMKQKRVDLNIGLDVAWLSSKRIVDRLILATGDSDFVPAMKFARREGVQVVLVPMGHTRIKRDLIVHADIVRKVLYP